MILMWIFIALLGAITLALSWLVHELADELLKHLKEDHHQ